MRVNHFSLKAAAYALGSVATHLEGLTFVEDDQQLGEEYRKVKAWLSSVRKLR